MLQHVEDEHGEVRDDQQDVDDRKPPHGGHQTLDSGMEGRRALETLRGSRTSWARLAHTLLDRETLEEDETYAAAGIQPAVPAAIARGEAAGMAVSDG
jgi:hypothetical protein